jgi:D-3-phosphoglycerate dehydrogenase
MFDVGRKIATQDRAMRSHGWARRAEFMPAWTLTGKTVGLVGFGHISRQLARKLTGFRINLLVCDPFVDQSELEAFGAESVELQQLLASADVVSLHTPLTDRTYHLIGSQELALMRPTAILINTARGKIVDEDALVDALRSGQILGAGLDVFEKEPAGSDNPLFGLDNVVVTPHTGGFSDKSVAATWRLSAESCIDLSRGRWPRSWVNREVKPRWDLR